MCILLNVKKHEKTFALNVDIFKSKEKMVLCLTTLYGNDRINRICHRCGRFLLYNCGCDGIGRHARFRFLCREACRFKSCHPHQNPGTMVPGFFADGDLESWDSRSPLPLRSVPGRRPPDVWHPVICINLPERKFRGFCVRYYSLESINARRF